MNESINFYVKRWDYNQKAPLINTHTDCQLFSLPLRANDSPEAKGIVFNWTLVLSGNDCEMLYYSSFEYYRIEDKNISDKELWRIVENTHSRSNAELAIRNLAVNLNTGLPPFRAIINDLKEIRSVLNM